MPTPPYAKVLTSIAGDTAVAGKRTVVGGVSTVQFSGESTVGWTQQRWELYAYPVGFTAPAGWTLDGSTQIIYSTAVTPPSFALPAAATRWGKWLIRLLVNEGVSNSQASAQLKDEVGASVSVPSPKGQVDVAALESTQADAFRGWVADYQANLRIIEPQLGGAGGSDATTLANGIVRLAGDLGGNGTVAAAPTVSGITGAPSTGKVTHAETYHELLTANQRLRDERFEFSLTGSADVVWSLTMPTGESWVVDYELVAHVVGGGNTNLYRATRKIKNVAGALTVTAIGTDVSSEDAAGTIDYTVSGTTVRLRYTKPAGTWRCVGRVTIDGAVA